MNFGRQLRESHERWCGSSLAWTLALVIGLAGSTAFADPMPAAVRAHAVRRVGAVSIDGKLEEGAWKDAPRQQGFTQRFPKDGIPAAMPTEFSVLYDDGALYVGVWAHDPQPAQIRKLLTRRDVDAPADSISIGFDSYHDRRTAYVFQLNAAGVQRDMLLFDDSKADDTWDAVWTGDAAIRADGWTAEFRIPLNQLRFAAGDAHEWGMQVVRFVGRTQEQVAWSPWPRSAPEVVSKFGVVDGIDKLAPQRRLELLPYASGGFDVTPVEQGDPLNDRGNLRRSAGLDLKYGLGPAFTLSATLNPDFGQVEADPSQVNLSGNELFFAEKRPFFLEGVDLFKLPIGNSDNAVEGTFYSRRIGAAPDAPDMDYDYIKAPTATAIYSAAKLTGKTKGGWSVGVFDAVTGQENATIVDGQGARSSPVVAPLTNYALARVKRDLNDGRTSIGVSASAVNRALAGTPLEASLHDQAYTAGLQLEHRFGTSAYQAQLHTVGSFVHGSMDAIALTQRSLRHLYQRPDLKGDAFDPTRTSLAGLGATWSIGRFGDTKHVRFGTGGDLRTRGLELNDLGFQTNSDRLIPFVWGQYRDDDPGDQVLNWQVNTDVFFLSTLEPTLATVGLECNGSVQLVNYWQLAAGCNLDDGRQNTSSLRGGRALHADPRAQGWININTDTRKPVWLSINGYGGRTPAAHAIDLGIDLGVTVQARSNIDLFLGPSYSERDDALQYIDEVADSQGGVHFVFGRIHQTVAGLTTRLNWTFSPHLTLQAYAQPYIASARYTELKDVDDPGARRFADRFTPVGGATLTDGTYTVRAPNNATYQVGRPDFDFRQLRSTLVLRWEYRPGSTVFAIWSHGQTSEIDDGRFQLGRDLRGLGGAEGENVVMVKANYWIGL